MWCVYNLRSKLGGGFYVGSTNNIERRVNEHNIGHTPATRNRGPWEVVYMKQADTQQAARERERAIKAWKSRTMIDHLIAGRASR